MGTFLGWCWLCGFLWLIVGVSFHLVKAIAWLLYRVRYGESVDVQHSMEQSVLRIIAWWLGVSEEDMPDKEIKKCGDCKHIFGEGAAGETCNHDRGNFGAVKAKEAPPTWCPLKAEEDEKTCSDCDGNGCNNCTLSCDDN